MGGELAALELNETWDLVPKPMRKKGIGSRWVYKIKYKANRYVERLKAKLVAKGHTQIEGFGHTKTFSPIATIVSIRTLLEVASIKNWTNY